MFCSECGNEISDSAKFCPSCGAKQLKSDEWKNDKVFKEKKVESDGWENDEVPKKKEIESYGFESGGVFKEIEKPRNLDKFDSSAASFFLPPLFLLHFH